MATLDTNSAGAQRKAFAVIDKLLPHGLSGVRVRSLGVAMDSAVLAGKGGDQAPVWLAVDVLHLGKHHGDTSNSTSWAAGAPSAELAALACPRVLGAARRCASWGCVS